MHLFAYTVTAYALTIILLGLLALRFKGKPGPYQRCAACNALEALYIPVYMFAVCADWLQGPYVYALYSALGFGRTDINILFVLGFGTSGLLGPFIGQLADQFGRKQMILVMYCGAYALSCITKHFDIYWVLALGRILGGSATSVLFSCFESWLVSEHHRRDLKLQELQQLLARQYFINGLAGCSMGILAQIVVGSIPLHIASAASDSPLCEHLLYGGETLPFDMSAFCLAVAALLICFLWSENTWHGAKPAGGTEAHSEQSRFMEALSTIKSDYMLVTIMLVSATTESAMYVFVIEWTPALTLPGNTAPPYGIIFSCFMIAYMSGTVIFGILADTYHAPALLIGFTSLSLLACTGTWLMFHAGQVISAKGTFIVFCLLTTFEAALGGYMGAIAMLKATYIPDSLRATLYNLIRVPLNLIVVVVNFNSLSSEFTFLACMILLGISVVGAICISLIVNVRSPNGTEGGKILV